MGLPQEEKSQSILENEKIITELNTILSQINSKKIKVNEILFYLVQMYRKVTNPDFKKIFPKDENEIGEKLLNIIKGRGGINEPEDFIISLTSTKTEVERYIEKIK